MSSKALFVARLSVLVMLALVPVVTAGTFNANMTGTVNGVNFSLTGAGTRDPAAGTVNGEYDISTTIPNFDLQLMNAFLITGYPSDALPESGALNPFVGVSYTYTRTLTLDDGKQLFLNANCQKTGDNITSTFSLSGQSQVPDLTSVQPLSEVWSFPGPGHVHGRFEMVWNVSGGGTRRGVAVTDYTIPSNIPFPQGNETRDISITGADVGMHLTRHQVSVLHAPTSLPGVGRMALLGLALLLLASGVATILMYVRKRQANGRVSPR